jgi:hypothetical protein
MVAASTAYAQQPGNSRMPAGAHVSQALDIRIIPSAEHTWGYDIYSDGRLFIHQPSVPGLPGNRGFASQQKAKKAADIVCRKIRKGITPPTVSIEELKTAHLISNTP